MTEKFMKVAVDAAKKAGKIMVDNLDKDIHLRNKGEGDYMDHVTDIDLKCDKAIREVISQAFPDHNILTEESGFNDKSSEYTWVIDPLDGTANYSRGIKYFCTSIGLKKNKETIVGVVYDPDNKELFTAEKGKGAFLNGKKIRVSNTKDINKCFLWINWNSTCKEIKCVHERLLYSVERMRSFGSITLSLCYVACGRADICIHNLMNEWDVIAASLIIEEAGGKVTDLKGNAFKQDRSLLATNGLLHEKMLEVLEEY